MTTPTDTLKIARDALADLIGACKQAKVDLTVGIRDGDPVHPVSAALTWPLATAINNLAAIDALPQPSAPSAEPAEWQGRVGKRGRWRRIDPPPGETMEQRVAYLRSMPAYEIRALYAAPQQTAPQAGPVGAMTAGRAMYFMERFKREEKLLGPNEQAALAYVIALLERATPPAAPVPTAQPLTDQRIEDGASEAGYNVYKLTAFVEGARFAEAQHGIGTPTTEPTGSAAP